MSSPVARYGQRFPILLLAAAFAAPLAAQGDDPVDQTPGVETPTADERADLRRVLHGSDGRILRVRSRRVGERWEIREGPSWRPLEGVEIVRAISERELLAEARRRESALAGPSDEGARVELARWMIEEGLHEEAFAHLDRELREDPDSPTVLDLLAETSPALDLELDPRLEPGAAELSALIVYGAGASPARAEAAVARLARFEDRVDLDELVRAELTTRQPQRRAFAALLARRLFPRELVPELARRAILDGMGDVRHAATLALCATDDVAVLAPTASGLASKNAAVRNHAAEALGVLGHPAAVEPLVGHLAALAGGGAPSGTRANMFVGFQTTYVMDYDVEIAQAASIADPIIAVQASGVMLDARTAVQITREIEILTTIGVLQKLTGLEKLQSPQAWQSWWLENGAEWGSAKLARARPHLRIGPDTTPPR